MATLISTLGNILFQQGHLRDAMAEWQKAHTTETKDARFHTVLADSFLRAGLQKHAIAEYEYAAGIAQDPLPRNNLAWLLAMSSDASIRDGNPNSPKKPSDFPVAKIRAIYERSQLQAPKVDVSARRKKLLGGRCEQQSSCTTALWSTRFAMKSHSTSSGFHVISSNGL
jgi:tetratricopeptide (TPR) repeat protein